MSSILEQYPRTRRPRNETVGASESPAILGQSPWVTPYQVWLAKTKDAPVQHGSGGDNAGEVGSNAAMRRGTASEPVLSSWYAEVSPPSVRPSVYEDGLRFADPAIVHRDFQWMTARPDGFAGGPEFSGDHWLVEFKTSRQPVPDLPIYYRTQVEHQLAVCEAAGGCVVVMLDNLPDALDWALGSADPKTQADGQSALAALLKCGALTPRIWRVERDDSRIARLQSDLAEWRTTHLVLGAEPATSAGDTGAYTGPLRELATHLDVTGTDHETRLVLALSAYKDAQAMEKDAVAVGKAARAELEAAMVAIGTDRAKCHAGQVTWAEQSRAGGMDSERLQREFPEAFAVCQKPASSFRVLRVK